MKMTHKDALHILGITTQATLDEIKAAYRKACSQYHPDRNIAGLEMMKLVNAAYDSLQDYVPTFETENQDNANYGDAINAALGAIIDLGLEIEICGSWVWVGGDTRTHKETLKAAGFKFAPKKVLWHFRPPEYKSYNRGKWDMSRIRETHGSHIIKQKSHNRIEAA